MYTKIADLKVGDRFMEDHYPEVWEVTKLGSHTTEDGRVYPLVETVAVEERGLMVGEESRVGETCDWWSAPEYEYMTRLYRV